MTAEAGYEVVANGRLVSRTPRAGRVRWVYEQPEPMAPYLATLQVGRYLRDPRRARARRRSSRPGCETRPSTTSAARAEMIALFEELFGPYPFASYTVVVTDDDLEIPLEAQGLSVFGANHMDGRRGSERLVAHELAHQWFGNSLTVGLWRDIWLHEGFACYAEWLWSEASGGRTADEQARAAHARLAGLPQDLVIGDPGPDAMFDDRLYKRGALTLHALRTDARRRDVLRAPAHVDGPLPARHGEHGGVRGLRRGGVRAARWRPCCTRGCTSGPAGRAAR